MYGLYLVIKAQTYLVGIWMDKAEVVKPKNNDGVVKIQGPPKEVKPSKEDKAATKSQALTDKNDIGLKYKKMAMRMSDRVLKGQLKSKRNPKELLEALMTELKRRNPK